MTTRSCSNFQERLKKIILLKLSFARAFAENQTSRDFSEVRKIENSLKAEFKPLRRDAKVFGDIQKAKEILKKDCLGPEELEKIFPVEMKMEDVPPIPFSSEELAEAKKMGQFLILRIPEFGTLGELEKVLDGKTKNPRESHFTSNVFSYNTMDKIKIEYVKSEMVRSGWALVSKDYLPHSTGQDFITQLDVLAGYLEDNFGEQMPPAYREAIDEYQKEKKDLQGYFTRFANVDDWPKWLSEFIRDLKIIQLTRPTAIEMVYDSVAQFLANGTRIFKNNLVFTNNLTDLGEFITLGNNNLGKTGLKIYAAMPNTRFRDFGTIFSRRKL